MFVRSGQAKKIISKINEELEKKKEFKEYVRELKIAEEKDKELIKNCIFCYCSFDNPELLNFFYKIDGVSNFLNKKEGSKLPDPVSEKRIKEFFNELKKNDETIVEQTPPQSIKEIDFLNIKDKVKIVKGPFSGYNGIITKLNNKKKTSSIKISNSWEIEGVLVADCEKI